MLFGSKKYEGSGPNHKHSKRVMNDESNRKIDKLIKEVITKKQTPAVDLQDIKHKLKYSPGVYRKPILHIGQRKLNSNELQFMTDHYVDDMVIIYAGAAPCNHLGYLMELFPRVKFVLVDPNDFLIYTSGRKNHFDVPNKKIVYLYAANGEPGETWNNNQDRDVYALSKNKIIECRKREIKKNKLTDCVKYINEANVEEHQVFLYEDLFTDEMASEFAAIKGNKYFISDIRTNVRGFDSYMKVLNEAGVKVPQEPGDFDLIYNLAQQFNWIVALKSTSNMLKFRMPFYNKNDMEIFNLLKDQPAISEIFELSKKNGIDFVKNYNEKKFIYVKSQIKLQPWTGANSTETRLVFDDVSNFELFDDSYEDILFYYNNVQRPYGYHINDKSDKNIGFDHCGDCALEAVILKNYENKFNRELKDYFSRLKSATGERELSIGGHGSLFAPLTFEQVLKMRSNSRFNDE